MLSGSCSSAIDMVSASWQGMVELTGRTARARISRVSGDVDEGRENVRVILKNAGQTALADFSRWDVIVQYYGQKFQGQNPYFIKRLAFTEGVPGNDEWRVEGIFEDAQTSTPEVLEPGVFNPGEEIKIHMKLSPKVGTQTTNWAIVVTYTGVTVPVIFAG